MQPAEHDAVAAPPTHQVETTQETFASESRLLEHAHGARVVRVARGGQALETQQAEPELDEEPRDLGRVALTPAVPSDRGPARPTR
jgi:hypothetical protein